jgi:hypothetical protein
MTLEHHSNTEVAGFLEAQDVLDLLLDLRRGGGGDVLYLTDQIMECLDDGTEITLADMLDAANQVAETNRLHEAYAAASQQVQRLTDHVAALQRAVKAPGDGSLEHLQAKLMVAGSRLQEASTEAEKLRVAWENSKAVDECTEW